MLVAPGAGEEEFARSVLKEDDLVGENGNGALAACRDRH